MRQRIKVLPTLTPAIFGLIGVVLALVALFTVPNVPFPALSLKQKVFGLSSLICWALMFLMIP
jgi:hypothetical protein